MDDQGRRMERAMTGTATTTVEQRAQEQGRALYGPNIIITRLTGTEGRPGYFQAYAAVPSGGRIAIGPSFVVS